MGKGVRTEAEERTEVKGEEGNERERERKKGGEEREREWEVWKTTTVDMEERWEG